MALAAAPLRCVAEMPWRQLHHRAVRPPASRAIALTVGCEGGGQRHGRKTSGGPAGSGGSQRRQPKALPLQRGSLRLPTPLGRHQGSYLKSGLLIASCSGGVGKALSGGDGGGGSGVYGLGYGGDGGSISGSSVDSVVDDELLSRQSLESSCLGPESEGEGGVGGGATSKGSDGDMVLVFNVEVRCACRGLRPCPRLVGCA